MKAELIDVSKYLYTYGISQMKYMNLINNYHTSDLLPVKYMCIFQWQQQLTNKTNLLHKHIYIF